MAKLILLVQGQAKTYELKAGDNFLGRLPDCDIQIDFNMVSRKHARVFAVEEQFLIEDLGSGNGTFVNGQKIEKPMRLKSNDRIELGPVLFRYEGIDSPSSSDSGLGEDSRFGQISIEGGDSSSTITGRVGGNAFDMLDVKPSEKLKAVLEIIKSLAGTIDIDKILPKLLDTLFGIFPHADRGCVLLLDEKSNQMIPRAMKHRRADADDSVKLSRTILKTVIETKETILSADASSDSKFNASESISSLAIRSMMCAPLLGLNGDVLGVINIDTQNPLAQFRTEDAQILTAVAVPAALAYEGARLMQSYVEKQKQDNEMLIASNVQLALLPERMPDIEGYSFFAMYESAQAVGGDYYDVVQLPNGKIAVAFGDVAGKGVPASLIMSRLSTVVRSVTEFLDDAGQAIEKINGHMCARAVEGRFVTFVLIILDPIQHKMALVNAGHMSPIIRKPDGTLEEFSDDIVGVPLGVVDGYPYDVVMRDIGAGETFVIYTDGVSEAMNAAGDLYGVDALRKLITQESGDTQTLGTVIRSDVRRHANGRPQNDDITLMVFGRNAP
ncbi:MAG: FHA domain-containing protein [Planctomycetota bacterium]|nr:MAG: FHA domain-containing protein [Planctomycetota bacterium]